MWKTRELSQQGAFYLRDTSEPSGAGVNRWSESNVQSDGSSITLGLKPIDGFLRASELVRVTPVELSQRLSGTIELDLANMKDNTVFGLFLYHNDSSELDIEVTRWGKPGGPNLHFSVHGAGHRTQSYKIPEVVKELHASICMSSKALRFVVVAGEKTFEWKVTSDLPDPLPRMAHINLWSRTPNVMVVDTVRIRDLTIEDVSSCE